MKIWHFDPMRGSISTSAIHFIISKPASAVSADATEVPTSRHKSSSTNGLAAIGPQSGSKFKRKIFGKFFFRHHYDQKNTLIPLVKFVFKSDHNYWRYLQFCDRSVYNYARRPILRTGLRPVQLFTRDSIYAIARLCDSDVSVRLSVTRRYCA